MRRYLILLGLLTLVLAQWGCGDGDDQPSIDAAPDGEEVGSAPSPAPPSPSPPPPPPGGGPPPPPPPPPPGGGTSGETEPGTEVQESGSPAGAEAEFDEAEFEAAGAEEAPKDVLLGNLSEIGEAMIKYHKKYNKFPPAVHFGGNKRLLSWRVLLLPFLGEGALFDQFKKDEPWDSPNNKPLADQMPDVYKTPDGHGPPKTCYVVPAGIGILAISNE